MEIKLLSCHEQYPISTSYVKEYKMSIHTPEDSLAKSYEEEIRMKVVLQVPKAQYQDENILALKEWFGMGVSKDAYYRDVALYLSHAGGFERSIVFTHARVEGSMHNPVEEDYIIITMVFTQKESKLRGVAAGTDLDETYQKAWEGANSPSGLRVVEVEKNVYAANQPSVAAVNPVQMVINTNGQPFIAKNLCPSCELRSSCKTRNINAFVYQSENKAGEEKDGSTADDMVCNDYTIAQMKTFIQNNSSLSKYAKLDIDLLDYHTVLFDKFQSMVDSFFTKNAELKTVAFDMMNHFKEGIGNSYSNPVLTKHAKAHPNTEKYVSDVTGGLKMALGRNNGDIFKAIQDGTFVKLINKEVIRPKFNTTSDITNGLTIIAHDTHGLMLNAKNYTYCPKIEQYEGILEFDIYDHFGVDLNDVTEAGKAFIKFGSIAGFRYWYYLQHIQYKNDNGAFMYTPFIDHMVFEHSFTGIPAGLGITKQ